MFELGILIFMLVSTYAIGTYVEQRHYGSIRRREKMFLNKPAFTIRNFPETYRPEVSTLAVGSVVISVDYFKTFIATLQLLVGGELKSYSSLIDRARREALLRMKESCPKADMYINTRFETSSISSGQGKTIGSVEVLCYATAVKLQKHGN